MKRRRGNIWIVKKESKVYLAGLSVLIIVLINSFTFKELPAANNFYLSKTAFANTVSSDSLDKDTSSRDLLYPLKPGDKNYRNNLDLKEPDNVTKEVIYNPETGMYEERTKVGNRYLPGVRMLTKEEYMRERQQELNREYFRNQGKTQNIARGGGGSPTIDVTPKALQGIFGAGLIEIQPSGSAELTFGININRVKNPAFSIRQQKPPPQFLFDQKLQVAVNGNIGDRVKLGIRYDTEALFTFENQTKLDWVGQEDDIIKKIELGNVSLPLNGSLIQGGQSLFGIKTQMQFGRLMMTTILSQNRGERQETMVTGGAQVTEFNIQADQYDVNRHFFLSQYFYDAYDAALSNLPIVSSGVMINQVEVWVTNRNANFENPRDVVAFMDLGESRPFNPSIGQSTAGNLPPNNNIGNNNLYNTLIGNQQIRNGNTVVDQIGQTLQNLENGLDYEVVNYARKLNPNEYTFHPRLGYISLNQALNNDEVLAVAFEYKINGEYRKVGEFSRDIPDEDNKVLFLKMLKGNTIRTRVPIWKLMMKNIYSLNTFNLNTEDFILNVIYADDPSGAYLNYLPVDNVPGLSGGKPLIDVLNLDKINRQGEAKPDGMFDAIDGITVNQQRGLIIFPVAEPFGGFLRSKFGNDSVKADRYAFDALYDSTKWMATQDVYKNKFFLRGQYKGSSSAEISLNAINVPPGSVQVFANGAQLRENADYIVDYNSGKVTILNQGLLESGANITVSSENQTGFQTQQKTLMGSRFDYMVNEKLNIGGTILHMYERPLTPKTNIGDDPLMNTIYGADLIYNSSSRFLTRLVDKIPFIETKEESNILFQTEYARLVPGKARSITKGERGVSYIDDFEAAETPFDMKMVYNWKLASFPQKQPDLFPEWQDADKIAWLNYRSLLAWYQIDPTFFRNDRFTPEHIKNDIEMQSNHFMREVTIKEVYPNKQLQQGMPNILTTLDMAFYPKSRGPYNFNAGAQDFNQTGIFTNPARTWGGIMRRIETNDFEAANIDYIEIWMMDPYVYNPASVNTGSLYINLGNISEDILPDRRKAFENGFPKDGNQATVDESRFGRVPVLPQINNAFDNEPSTRPFQDVGIDGLNDEDERSFYKDKFLDSLAQNFGVNSPIYQAAFQDPSNDNYLHNRDEFYTDQKASILNRYKRFNGMQGNSTLEQLSDGSGPKAATTLPDVEDINNDFTMNQTEDYFQYKIDISPEGLQIGQNFVTDITEANVLLANGENSVIKWYQLKIPVREFEKAVGNISDFKSIRFMRMFMTGFSDSIVLRLAQFQLVRADWRRHTNSLKKPGINIPVDPVDKTVFTVSTVNIEENGMRQPVNYVTPPGIPRVIDPITPGAIELNEQSIALNVCNLEPGDARGAFKTMNLDIRNYKYMKMFIHIDPTESGDVRDNEMEAFIRLGTDLSGNYYEYAIPLVLSASPTGQGGTYRPEEVWPEQNNMDFELEEFYKAKQERENTGTPQTKPFIRKTGIANNAKVTLIGLPDLSNVRVIMIGVRNISDRNLCAEVWYNELRVTDVANKGGWAANARLVAQLADFSTINLTGSIRTIGFGGIDQRLNQRSLHDHYQYDLSSNIELGKFFPAKTGLTIPMFINKNENIIQPKFNPLNPDIELKTTLSLAEDATERNAIRKAAEDYTSKYSINFVNVRKNRTSSKTARPWDIENFNASYSYQNLFRRNQQIEEQIQKTYRGSLGYIFSYQPKPWEPLRKRIKSKHLDLLKDFNFFPIPQTFNVRFDVDRYYSELKNRSNDIFRAETPRLYDKNFTMTRFYSLGWNLTKNLKFDYQSNVNARIEEPVGRLDTEEKKDSVKREFFSLGKMTQFNQTGNISYNVPLNKIKALNWITVSSRYSGNFGWEQAPPAFPGIGNTIQNSQVINFNSQLNMLTFYNKFPVLRKINTPARSFGQRPGAPGRPVPGKKEEEEKEKKKEVPTAVKNILRTVMMLKNITFSYTENRGTVLPGFVHTPQYLGHNFNENSPGASFIMGGQDPDIRYRLAQNGSLSRDVNQFNFYVETSSRTYNGKATIEPLKDFRIDLDFNLSVSNMVQSTYRFDTTDRFNSFRDLDVNESGMFTMSHIFWRTAFKKDNKDKSSPNFQQFENNRYVIAGRKQNEDERIAVKQDDSTTSYPLGYSKMHQDVLIASFVAAYTGTNQQNSKLSPFRNFPLPNWRINYNGLSKIEFLKKYFTNISLTHSYKGTYTVAGYRNNQEYLENPNQTPEIGKDMFTEFQFEGISLIENFGPLAGINLTLKNNWNVRTEYRKSRAINLNLAGGNVSENNRSEITIGGGYRAKDVLLPFKYRGKRILLENDLNFNMDFSVMNNIMIVRRLDDLVNEPVSGSVMISIKPTLDYMVNERINISIFLDHRTNKPKTSQAFPTALTDFGIRLRYTLQ